MKKNIIILCFFLILTIANNYSFDKEIQKKLSGVWAISVNIEPRFVTKFSWGYSKTFFEGHIEIDLEKSYYKDYMEQGFSTSVYDISEIKTLGGNTYEIKGKVPDLSTHKAKEDSVILKFINKKEIQIIKAPQYFRIGLMFKISGPDIPFTDYYTVKYDNVNLIDADKIGGIDKPIIRQLNKEEKVVIIFIPKNKETVINKVKGYWVKVESVIYGDNGYCLYEQVEPYDKGFLSKIKDFKDKLFHKKYYTSKIDNLRFRETPTLDGKFIRLLVKGEKLELLERGKTEEIDGVKGYWLKLKTEKNDTGWAFSGYLEEVK